MTRKAFTQRPDYWEPKDKAAAINAYAKQDRSVNKIAVDYNCSKEKVEKMLKIHGYLLN